MLQEAKRIIQKTLNPIEEYFESKHIPINYSFDCEVMNDQGQMENNTFVISRYRIFLIPQRMFSNQNDNYKEFSILNVQSIIVGGPNLYHLFLKDGDFILFTTTKDIEPLIKSIIEMIEPINFNSPKPYIVQFGGFDKDYLMEGLKFRPEMQSKIRYEAVCSIYKQSPNPDFEEKLKDFDKTQRTFIMLTKKFGPVVHPHILSFPFLAENNLTIIHFKQLCPNIICSVLSHIMKYSDHLSTVIFEDYPDMKPDQLNFLKLKSPSVVSWHFRNCFFKSTNGLINLFNQFSVYKGDVQTLLLDNIIIDKKMMAHIDYQLATCHCFQSLEILHLTNLVISEVEVQDIYQAFIRRIRTLQSILHFAFTTQWSSIIQLNNATRLISSTLQSLVLKGMNLINIPSISIPENMTNLEFIECFISPYGLCNIIKSISEFKKDICLNVRDFDLDKNEWPNLEKMFSDLPPLSNLLELDWSGNPIPETFMKDFIRVFLNVDKIRFLAISRVFKTNGLSQISDLINHLANSRIWGLDIEGHPTNEDYQYGDAILVVILQLAKITSLEHLNINNHFFSEDTFDLISMAIKNDLKMVHEIMMDGTTVSTAEKLFQCYTNLVENVQPKEVLRPMRDIERLIFANGATGKNKSVLLSFGGGSNAGQSISRVASSIRIEETEKMIEFRSALLSTKNPSTKLLRTSFYHFSNELNPGFGEFLSASNPSTDLSIAEDPLNLNTFDQFPRSLHDINNAPFCRPFGTYQAFLIDSPYMASKSENLHPFKLPAHLAKFKKFKPHIDAYYVDDLHLIQPDQVMKTYEKLATPEFLKTLNSIDEIMEIFDKNGEKNSDDFQFEKDFKKPPLFVSKAAIDFMRNSCLLMEKNKDNLSPGPIQNDNS